MVKENNDIPENKGWLKKGYRGLIHVEKFIGHFLLLIIRVYWGSLLFLTGLGKWMSINDVALYFKSLQIPLPYFSACLVASCELLGGIFLFVGLFSRIAPIFLTIIFATAYATAHKAIFTHFFSHPSQFTTQEPFLYLYASLVVLCFGAGMFSIDYWLERRTFGKPL